MTSSSSPISRFLLESPRSIRNFVLILGCCLSFDHFLATNETAYNTVNDDFYRRFIYPWASNRMFEPQIAVLSFMVACTVFSITKLFIKKNNHVDEIAVGEHRTGSVSSSLSRASSSVAPENNQVINNTSSSSSFVAKIINGDISSWAFWAIANVGLYLGLIDIFQRVTEYGGRMYRVNENWKTAGSNEMFISTRIFLEVFLSILAYDLIFSVVHKSFHSKSMPQWWQKMHLIHHDHYQKAGKPLHVMVTFHHHIIDATVQIMINAALQQIITLSWVDEPLPRHTMSKMLHNIFVTYLLVESHSGQDWGFMTHRWLFPEWFKGGSSSHQIHHNTGKAPYHQFFTVFDDF